MIVEDEDLIRALAVDAFTEAGFAVLEVSTGDEALEVLFSGEAVDVIVSDIRMPGATDGLKLRREVEIRWPNIKMVLTSGHMEVERSELSENQLFVGKPYKFLELVREVEGLLSSHQSKNQSRGCRAS